MGGKCSKYTMKTTMIEKCDPSSPTWRVIG
jgi:hypothetical protein